MSDDVEVPEGFEAATLKTANGESFEALMPMNGGKVAHFVHGDPETLYTVGGGLKSEAVMTSAVLSARHEAVREEMSRQTEVHDLLRVRDIRRRADQAEARALAAALDSEVMLAPDWQPMTVAEAAAKFEHIAGKEWIEDIVPKAGKGNTFGPSRSAKTVYLHYVALAAANANPEGGSVVFGHPINERFGTVMIALEDAQNQHARLDAMARKHGWSTDGVLIVAPEDPPHVDQPDTLVTLVASVRAGVKALTDLGMPLGQVVIDTGKYLIAGKDGNSSEAHSVVTTLLGKLTRVSDGAYVNVVTHTPLSDDGRPVGSHDQTASRDHEVSVKDANSVRHLTLTKHKFAEVGRSMGTFTVMGGETPYSPRPMPVLVELSGTAAAFMAGEAHATKAVSKEVAEVEEFMDYVLKHGDPITGTVDQGALFSPQASGGFGQNKANRVRTTINRVDGTWLTVAPVDGKNKWSLQPGLTKDMASDKVREVLG